MTDHEDILIDLGNKTDEELRKILDELYTEEERLSYERRVLHGRIDILKAELTERLKKKREKGVSVISGEDIERLTQILARGMSRKKTK